MSEQFLSLAELKLARKLKTRGKLVIMIVPSGYNMYLMTDQGDKFIYCSARQPPKPIRMKTVDSFFKLINENKFGKSSEADNYGWDVRVVKG